jgi:hypothetical protein
MDIDTDACRTTQYPPFIIDTSFQHSQFVEESVKAAEALIIRKQTDVDAAREKVGPFFLIH